MNHDLDQEIIKALDLHVKMINLCIEASKGRRIFMDAIKDSNVK